MTKSQYGKFNLFIFILFFVLTSSKTAFCNTYSERLSLADSLFNQKKYTQAFELYEQVYRIGRMASPAMLLKMAFVKEGLGDYSQALYYLNLHYLLTYDKKVLKKMENLAAEHRLFGYDYNDVQFFLNLYHQYQTEIDSIILALTLLLFTMLIYRRRAAGRIRTVPGALFIGLLMVLFALNNFGREQPKAIINAPDVYLMDGPSSGANVVEVVSQGHRVDVLGKTDVWSRIAWQDKEVYIKSFNLKHVIL